jgi:hypothetical protein
MARTVPAMRTLTRFTRYGKMSLLAGALVFLAHSTARGQAASEDIDTARARTTILRLESRWLAAHDSATLAGILAPDFVHPVASGQFLDRSQHIEWVVAHPPDSSIDRRLADMRVRFYGATAIVTGTVVRSREGAEMGRNVFTDIFVKRDGRWQAVSAEETMVGG